MNTKRIAGFIVAAGLFFSAPSGVALAETGAQTAKALALRNIMKELGANMQVITDGISREDWALIEKTAPLIADHPQPPISEKLRIISFMGGDMGRFKGYDEGTHKAAEELKQAAGTRDGHSVITSFQRLQMTCYGCHHEFRQPFLKHFYPAR